MKTQRSLFQNKNLPKSNQVNSSAGWWFRLQRAWQWSSRLWVQTPLTPPGFSFISLEEMTPHGKMCFDLKDQVSGVNFKKNRITINGQKRDDWGQFEEPVVHCAATSFMCHFLYWWNESHCFASRKRTTKTEREEDAPLSSFLPQLFMQKYSKEATVSISLQQWGNTQFSSSRSRHNHDLDDNERNINLTNDSEPVGTFGNDFPHSFKNNCHVLVRLRMIIQSLLAWRTSNCIVTPPPGEAVGPADIVTSCGHNFPKTTRSNRSFVSTRGSETLNICKLKNNK